MLRFSHPILLALLLILVTDTLNAQDRPNILWITTEDISAALGSYGDDYAVTPNLDALAARGVRYTQAFASAPICAPARSALITGVHATSLSTQHLRSEGRLPDFIQTIPEYLRAAGYYTTNNAKTDYNFSPENRWDASSSDAHWRNRPADAPFFSVVNFMTTHEGPTNNNREDYFEDLKTRHDPAKAELPPYFPDTPEMRRIWAKLYDLITVMDGQAGAVLDELEADGLLDNTIIFFFSDHGHGLPRYKRWAYRTGYHIPLIIAAPPKYQHLLPGAPGETTDEFVSFVDLAPTVLRLAGLTPPQHMQGRVILGQDRDTPRTFFVGARSRADDVYDMSRTVIDDRYVYIRNYMPYKPYIQEALIFGNQKASYAEIHRARAAGLLPPSGEDMFQPKAEEELYDLKHDPYELTNLAARPEYTATLQRMRARLASWTLQTRDAGFLNEAEVMLRSAGSTPYEMAQDPEQYNLLHILAAAERVGNPAALNDAVKMGLSDTDSGARYWSALAIQAAPLETVPAGAASALRQNINDSSPVVAIASAETLCKISAENCQDTRDLLISQLQNEDQPWLTLQAAISMRRIGNAACPVKDQVAEIFKMYSGNTMGRYKNWMYPMFVGFALDQVMMTCGVLEKNPLER